jgi:hypothetical protein
VRDHRLSTALPSTRQTRSAFVRRAAAWGCLRPHGSTPGPLVEFTRPATEPLSRYHRCCRDGRRTDDPAGGDFGGYENMRFGSSSSRITCRRDPGRASFTFVTAGVESALHQARAVAGRKNVRAIGHPIRYSSLRKNLLDRLTDSNRARDPWRRVDCLGTMLRGVSRSSALTSPNTHSRAHWSTACLGRVRLQRTETGIEAGGKLYDNTDDARIGGPAPSPSEFELTPPPLPSLTWPGVTSFNSAFAVAEAATPRRITEPLGHSVALR